MSKKYMQRVDKQSGPSLSDYIYKKSLVPESDSLIKNSFNNYIIYNQGNQIQSSQDFISRSEFKYDRNISWFTSQMASGKLNISKKKKAVDCVLEVRDARAPLTSSNFSILDEYTDHISKLVILNKSDLVPKESLNRSKELLEYTGQRVIMCNSLTLRKLSKIKKFVVSNVKPRFPSLGFWLMVVGLPNVGKSSLIKSMKHHSFVQQWHSKIPISQQETMKKTKPRVENKPGSTKLLDFFNISLNPKIYCFDTPGIMLPKMSNPEINLKLAALGCLDDSTAGEDYIADYILYRLNKINLYTYVKTLDLPGPCDDISKIASHISNIIEKKWNSVDPTNCYKIFINQFRMGFFGKICLDDLSQVIKLEELDDYRLRNKTLFIINKTNFYSNPNYGDELLLNYTKHTRAYRNEQDSIRNPYQNRNKELYSLTTDTVVEYVNCSDTAPTPEPSFMIPYDDIHTCSFDGHESLSDILENLKEPLRHSSRRLFFDHKSLMLDKGLNDFEDTASRSIKALTYWIGSRIMNTVKIARDKSDSQGFFSAEDSISERLKCNEVIRKILDNNLEIWNSKNTREIHNKNVLYPNFNKEYPKEFADCVWSYFNNRVFNNLLPEFKEFNFEWFDVFDEKYRNNLTKSGEVFMFGDIYNMSLPKLMFPEQLKNYPSSLGNAVFRSMSKLLCDIYSPYEDVDFIKILINSFKFVESNNAKEEGLNFVVIQRNYESLVNYDSGLVSLFNSKNDLSKDYDLNDPAAVFLDTNHLPFIKNNFHLLSIYRGDVEEALNIYEESFKIGKEPLSRNMWTNNLNLTVPTTQIGRSLLNGDLDEFSNIIGYSFNELLKLKPIQLNFIQNRIVSTCIKFLNSLRSLDFYCMNYLFAQTTTSPNKTIQELNLPMIQSILFTMNVQEKAATNNNLYPLSNEFIRKRPLEEIIDVDELCNKEFINVYETRSYNRYMKQKSQDSVQFIKEYLDPSVAPDDPDALRFLLSYYNFNLFGARLPIDINIRFKYIDYLSSNDVSSVLTTPTIYINPLFKNNKILIARLILNECFKIYLKWSNKFVSEPSSRQTSLNDIMEQNLEQRLKNHILNCSERSLSWPFYLDDLYISNGEVETKKDMDQVFKESFETEDIVKVMDNMIKRNEIEQIWSEHKIPIREFLTSLLSGLYDLAYGIIANSESIKVASKLSLNEINYLENKFKQVCEIYFNMLDPRDNKLNSVLYLEALSIVESGFNELREQCIKNTLIFRKDLLESIADVSNILTNSVQVHNQDSNIQLDKNTHECKTTTNTPDISLEEVSLLGITQKISNDDALDVCLLLYNKYNKFLFYGFLPDVEIKFVDLDELSTIKVDLSDFSRPTILMNKLIDDVNLLNSQLVVQMVFLSYYYFRRITSDDFVNQFGEEFKSSFNVIHNTRSNYLKSKMIPINLEKKINSNKGKKDHNKQYVEFINKTLENKNNDLVTLQANDFVYEVLEGRDKFKHQDKLSNQYESLQTLKAFAHHYFDSLSTKHKYTEELIKNPGRVGNDSNKSIGSNSKLTKSDPTTSPRLTITSSSDSLVNENNKEDSELIQGDSDTISGMEAILSIFNPGLMKNEWIKNMLEHVQIKLKEKGIGLFLKPSNFDWATNLDQNQQEKVIGYFSKNPNETPFTILFKSGVFNKQEAMDIIVKSMYEDPAFSKHKESTDINVGVHGTEARFGLGSNPDHFCHHNEISEILNKKPAPPVEVIRDDQENEDQNSARTTDVTPVDSVEEFFQEEISKVLGNIPPNDHNTFMLFFNKLVDRDFMYCRNILNSYNSPSFLVDKSMEMLSKINSHALLDSETYNDIKQFLHK